MATPTARHRGALNLASLCPWCARPQASFRNADANADGVLTKEEFIRAGMGTAADWAKADFNQDGEVTLDELRYQTEKKAAAAEEREDERDEAKARAKADARPGCAEKYPHTHRTTIKMMPERREATSVVVFFSLPVRSETKATLEKGGSEALRDNGRSLLPPG